MIAVWRKGLILTAVLLLALAYFWRYRPTSSPPTPEAHTRQVFAVDFALPDLHGKTVRLSELRGRPVLVNFWATWCYPCRVEMPSMNALYQGYKDSGFVILAIASDARGAETVAPFVQEYGLTFPVLLDPHNSV